MKAFALVAATVVAPACFAQYEQFPDVPDNHWVFKTLWNLKDSGYVDITRGFFRRTLRTEVAQLLLFAEKGLDTKLKESEYLVETKTAWREAYERSQKFAASYKDIEALLMMVDVFAEELKRMHVDPRTLERSLVGLRSRNGRVQVMSLLHDETSQSFVPVPTAQEGKLLTRNELALQLDSFRRSADLTVDEATELLLSVPSFELLCMLSLPPERYRVVSSLVPVIMPRPLTDCNVTTVLMTLRQLSDLPTDKLKLVIDQCEALVDELLIGEVPSKFTVTRPDSEGNYRWSDSWAEIGRKCALLLKYTFKVPDDEMYPWSYDASGNLTLLPSPKGVPNNYLGNNDFPQASFNKYSKYPRRLSR